MWQDGHKIAMMLNFMHMCNELGHHMPKLGTTTTRDSQFCEKLQPCRCCGP